MQIKICGITDVKEASYLNKNKVDYAGMVLFYPKSKRNIDIKKAQEIMSNLNNAIKKVAVVVSPTYNQVLEICGAGFDIIQIHGVLSDEVYNAITIPIWKAFNIKDMDQYDVVKCSEKITGFVFDSAEPGSGQAYSLDRLEHILRVEGKLYILAGGLNARNVADAINDAKPDVVDCSSGVEFGKEIVGKDPDKIDEFVSKVRV